MAEDDDPPVPLTGDDFKAFVKALLALSKKEVSSNDVDNVIRALGLDEQGHMTKEAKKDAFAKGIHTLCDVHFRNYAEKEEADILGELLFNSRVFAKEYCDEVIAKTTASVASCVFNLVSLLTCID